MAAADNHHFALWALWVSRGGPCWGSLPPPQSGAAQPRWPVEGSHRVAAEPRWAGTCWRRAPLPTGSLARAGSRAEPGSRMEGGAHRPVTVPRFVGQTRPRAAELEGPKQRGLEAMRRDGDRCGHRLEGHGPLCKPPHSRPPRRDARQTFARTRLHSELLKEKRKGHLVNRNEVSTSD